MAKGDYMIKKISKQRASCQSVGVFTGYKCVYRMPVIYLPKVVKGLWGTMSR